MRPRCAAPLLFALGLAVAAAQARATEALQIGTSADRIEITSDFSGGEFVVFGVIENAEESELRQGAYDIVVVLEGPRQPVVVRRKADVLGFWINHGAETLELAPASYVLASTRDLARIANEATRRQLALGMQYLRLTRAATSTPPPTEPDTFADAFIGIKQKAGLYNEEAGAVAFVAPTLFRAKLALPRDLPVGLQLVRVLLFYDGTYLSESSRPFQVVMAGLEGSIQQYASDHRWTYGAYAVLLAICVGWFGRVAFRRD
jgi:uncharacterized protein (TIGR02186 family)